MVYLTASTGLALHTALCVGQSSFWHATEWYAVPQRAHFIVAPGVPQKVQGAPAGAAGEAAAI